MTKEERTDEITLLHNSGRFFNVFCKMSDDETLHLPVGYYLLGHSIELSLKSILRKSKSLRQLVDEYGHDLQKLFHDASEIVEELKTFNGEAIISNLNIYYRSKDFEYMEQGYKSLPLVRDVCKLAIKIFRAAEKHAAQNKNHFRFKLYRHKITTDIREINPGTSAYLSRRYFRDHKPAQRMIANLMNKNRRTK